MKNIQFPYDSYSGHFCFGILYDRAENAAIDETKAHPLEELHSITSVISNIQFFVAEKVENCMRQRRLRQHSEYW